MKPRRSSPKVHISLDEDTHRRLRVVCAYRGTTIQAFVEDLIKKALADAGSALNEVVQGVKKRRTK